MTLEEQLDLADKYAEKAFASFLRFVKTHRQEIIAATRQGFIDGHEQYGDASWQKDYQTLLAECLAECRDGNAYMTIMRSRGWHL